MKKMTTIGRRLNIVQTTLVLLLLIGVSLALWAQNIRSQSAQRSEQLGRAKDRVYFEMVQLSDTFRGLLLEPKNETEQKRYADAGRNFQGTMASLQNDFPEQADMLAAKDRLGDYVMKTIVPFYQQVLAQAQTDPAAAAASYAQNYPPIRQRRDRFFADLAQQVLSVAIIEVSRAQAIATIGLGAIALILVASMMVGRFQSTVVAGPLNQLVSGIERMRVGDFTKRLVLDRQDEFGILGNGLNRLADDLSALVGQVQRSATQVNTTAAQIADTAREQQVTTNEIATTTAWIGVTSREISTTSKGLVKTMGEVNEVSQSTANLAGSGQTAITRMETTMRQIMDSSGAVTAKLAVLSERTANINNVVTTITKVADQTNLLSLNAAIEAEKAGEYGLGFSVVAMEIRRLADQTAVATYDIEKMVKEMQSAVAAGVMGMDKFSEEVRRGVEEISQVSKQLAQIINQVQTLTPRFQTVNEGMNAQAAGAQQISDTLTQLGESARRTAESLRQSNAAIERLNGAASTLQDSVARFKLES